MNRRGVRMRNKNGFEGEDQHDQADGNQYAGDLTRSAIMGRRVWRRGGGGRTDRKRYSLPLEHVSASSDTVRCPSVCK